MLNQYQFKTRGTTITDETQQEILGQFNFSTLSLGALGATPEEHEAPIPTYRGTNRRTNLRRQCAERRQAARFVGKERRLIESRRNEDKLKLI